MRRQKLLLALLLAVLVLAVLYAYWHYPRQRRAPRQEPGPQVAAREEVRPKQDLALRLELLEPRAEPFAGYDRNIFRLRPRPPVPTPSPQASAPPPAPRPAEPPPAAGETEPAAVERALARFTFVGFLQKGMEKTLFLRGEAGVFVVRVGDRFGPEDRFLAAEVTPRRLVIRQSGDPRPIIVPLVEQAPLAPARSPATGSRHGPEGRVRAIQPEPVAADAPRQEIPMEAPPPDFPWPHQAPGEVPHE